MTAVLSTQPSPCLPYTNQRLATTPKRPAAVPIQCWLTEPSVAVGRAG